MLHSMLKEPTDVKSKKILVIEDEGDMRLLLELMLNGEENLTIEHCQNLQTAEKMLQSEQPDVVLLDNKLPDGFGIDFIPYIRQNNPDTKVIMITGFDRSAEDVALLNGAALFLQKPFTKHQLFQAIMDQIGPKKTNPE
ncbi:MAG TPA: response regulator [Ferruginibacter sp.]|nr:response regulator [Ferruginibacter sp.]HRO17766.1 response regulator [Ferruginibacter sp.]